MMYQPVRLFLVDGFVCFKKTCRQKYLRGEWKNYVTKLLPTLGDGQSLWYTVSQNSWYLHIWSKNYAFFYRTQIVIIDLIIVRPHWILIYLVSGLRTGWFRLRIPTGQEMFHFSIASRQTMGSAQHPVQWALEFFVGVKRPGRDVNDLSLFDTELKNAWSCASFPPACRDDVEKDNFTLPLQYTDEWNRTLFRLHFSIIIRGHITTIEGPENCVVGIKCVYK